MYCTHLPTKLTVSFRGRTAHSQNRLIYKFKDSETIKLPFFLIKTKPGKVNWPFIHPILQIFNDQTASQLSGRSTLTVTGQHKKPATQSALHISGRFSWFILSQSSGTVRRAGVFQVQWNSLQSEGTGNCQEAALLLCMLVRWGTIRKSRIKLLQLCYIKSGDNLIENVILCRMLIAYFFHKDFSSKGLQQLGEGILSSMFPDILAKQSSPWAIWHPKHSDFLPILFPLFILHCVECRIFSFCESREKMCSLTLEFDHKQDKHLLESWGTVFVILRNKEPESHNNCTIL